MTDSMEITIRLLATAALIGVNALYVFHEFAFVALKPGQVRRFDQDRSTLSQLISKTSHRIDHYIAVDQLGITASSLAVGWVGQPVVTDLFQGLFGEVGLSSGVMTGISAAIAFGLLTGTQMVVGELVPKTYALRNAEGTAKVVAGPVEWTAKIFHPFVMLLNGIGLGLVRLMGFEGKTDSHAQVLPADELVTIVKSSARAGMLTADPRALSRLLHFSDLQAHDLMVPRMDLVAISVDADFADVLKIAQTHKYDRYPVYQGSSDQIVGVLNVKSLLASGVSRSSPGEVNWLRWVQPIPTLPESASVEVLLATFRRTQQPMVLLVDEFGATEGIVTVSDVTDQLIEGPDEIHAESPQGVRIDGHASIAIVEAELGIALNGEERSSDTIAGLVLSELGRIPEPGDSVVIEGHEIEVIQMDGHRIAEVFVRNPPEAPVTTED
ncbi:MAG: hemolysin family protein [Chloroflexota bacterium]|nr:hemolysin family protein [Chloroflexota bacterium]